MLNTHILAMLLFGVLVFTSCEDNEPSGESSLHSAFALFDADNTSIQIDGDEVIIETNGLPNHTSPYWSSPFHVPGTATEEHPLFVEPTVTSFANMAPGYIDGFNGSFSLTVSADPELASSSTSTGLGPIGIAVSGSVIYNDEEGPMVPLDDAAPSLDYVGAHTGPQSYHYHLEPTAWSEDDDALIGIIADGFFLYGRKCFSTADYPTDLDASNGHSSVTQYSDDEEYHYHIETTPYLGLYYILFPGDYQGTPSSIE
ncbi:MAG: hypothetical protein ACI959_000507 [Limisphaerales bacterium]|jgi:hypothetical protein